MPILPSVVAPLRLVPETLMQTREWRIAKQVAFPAFPATRGESHPCRQSSMDAGRPPAYIASGLSMPSQLSANVNSRRATAAVASSNDLRAGSSSLRMWCL